MNTTIKPHYHLQCSHDEYKLITRALTGVLTQDERAVAADLAVVIMQQSGVEMTTYLEHNQGTVSKIKELHRPSQSAKG